MSSKYNEKENGRKIINQNVKKDGLLGILGEIVFEKGKWSVGGLDGSAGGIGGRPKWLQSSRGREGAKQPAADAGSELSLEKFLLRGGEGGR